MNSKLVEKYAHHHWCGRHENKRKNKEKNMYILYNEAVMSCDSF